MLVVVVYSVRSALNAFHSNKFAEFLGQVSQTTIDILDVAFKDVNGVTCSLGSGPANSICAPGDNNGDMVGMALKSVTTDTSVASGSMISLSIISLDSPEITEFLKENFLKK